MGSDNPSSKRHHPSTPRRRLTTPQKPVLHPYALPTDFALLFMFMWSWQGNCHFINFLKISLSNVVSRTNFLPLRSGQKDVVYYPEAFSSWYTIVFAFCSEAKWLAKPFKRWAMLMSDFRGRGNSIILVSLKKNEKLSKLSHESPRCTAGPCVNVAMRRRSEPNFSYSLRSFLLDPMGSMEDTDGDGTRPHGISCGFLLCSSSQKTLLPSYLGALVNLFPIVYLWRKEHFQVYCDWGGEWDDTQSYTGSG